MDMQASELIVPSEGATCWENVMCTAQTRDHDGTRVYVPHMKVCNAYTTLRCINCQGGVVIVVCVLCTCL